MREKLKNLTREQVNKVFINEPNKKIATDSWVSVVAKQTQTGINFFIDTTKKQLAMGEAKNPYTPISVYIDNLESTKRLFNNKNTIFVHYPQKNEDGSYDILSEEITDFEQLKRLISRMGLNPRKNSEEDSEEDSEEERRIRESLSRYLSEKRSQLKTNIGVDEQSNEGERTRPRPGPLRPTDKRIRRL